MADVIFKRGLKANLPQTGDDRDTLYFTEDTGELYKSTGVGLPLKKYGGTNESTAVFLTNGIVPSGLQDSNIVLPFDCIVKSATVSYLGRDNELVRTSVYKSTDYNQWNDIFDNPVELIDGEYHKEITPQLEIRLNKGDNLRCYVNTLSNGNKNLSFNLNLIRL